MFRLLAEVIGDQPALFQLLCGLGYCFAELGKAQHEAMLAGDQNRKAAAILFMLRDQRTSAVT